MLTRSLGRAGRLLSAFRSLGSGCPYWSCQGAMRHLERLITKGLLQGLIHRSGLRADILTDGRIRIGSAIETLD